MSKGIMLSRRGRGWKSNSVSAFRSYDIVRRPMITEKASLIGEYNQYVFEVSSGSTKPEIKLAIEHLFKVEVSSVNTLNQRGKVKRFKGHFGKRRNYKKAIVTLKMGHSIDMSTGVKS